MSSLFNAMTVFQSVMPLTCDGKPSFYRERASQTYNAFWNFVGLTLAEIPYCFISSFIFTVIFFFMVGFIGVGTAVLFWMAVALLVLMQVYLGQFFSYASPSEEVAQIFGVLLNSIIMMFVGFSPPAYAISSGYTWLYNICPVKYPMAILISLVFADCDALPTWDEATQSYVNVGSQLGCQPMVNAPETVDHITLKEYTEQYFGFVHDRIPRDFGILILIVVLYRILVAFALRFINHQMK